MDCNSNGPAAGALLNNQFNQSLTTMASAITGGFLRLNSGVITTINTGVGINSWQVFPIHDESTLKLAVVLRHSNGSVANKQADIGFGYYDVAAFQAAAMNEFIGFRWTQAGALLGVLEYSVGGAPTTVTIPLNGGVPLSNDVAHTYEILVDNAAVEFSINGVFAGQILAQPDANSLTKASGLPLLIRLFNGGSAPATAPAFDLGSITISRIGPIQNEDRPTLQAKQGRHSSYPQSGTQTANGQTCSVPLSGNSPAALVPTNAVTGLVGLGGTGRATLTGVTATVHTDLIMNSFQNPLIPEAAGQANNARNLIITDILISPLIVSVVLAGGGFTAEWFVAIGATALSLATADAIGGATIGTRSPKKIMLPIFDTFAAAAAVGAISTRTGEQGLINLNTPLVVAPGDFLVVGLRTLFVAAAVTSGAVDFSIGFNGYWD